MTRIVAKKIHSVTKSAPRSSRQKFASRWHMVCQLPEEASWSLPIAKLEWLRSKAASLTRSLVKKRYTCRAERAFLSQFLCARQSARRQPPF